MKCLFIPMFALLFSLNVYAERAVDGKIVYVNQENLLSFKDVRLTASKGEDQKTKFTLTHGDHQMDSHAYWVKNVNGRKLLKIVFLKEVSADNYKAIIMNGTYLRGTNGGMYYGDMFKMHKTRRHDLISSLIVNNELIDHHQDLIYKGGFKFKKMISTLIEELN